MGRSTTKIERGDAISNSNKFPFVNFNSCQLNIVSFVSGIVFHDITNFIGRRPLET